MMQLDVSSADIQIQRPHEAGSQGRRLRVLTVIDRAIDCGGAERFAVGLAQHLPRDRIDSWLCSTRGGDADFAREIASSGIPHIMLGRSAKWDVHRLGGLVTLLRRERFDVLHAHKFGSNLWCSLIGRACRVPVVLAHEHTWSYAGDPLRMLLDRRVIGRLATRFIAVSPLDAERMVTLEHVPTEKVICIPTAYIPRTGGATSDIRLELGLAPGTPLVGVAAGLRPQKALTVLLEAHARLLGQIENAHLVIAGEGECRSMLEERARELGIAERVHFLGRRDDVEAIIASVDIAALSSDYEGLPLFVFECMANGTPLVATDVGGLREVIKDGVNGLLVPPRDPIALSDALASLLADGERRATFANAARNSISGFTIEAIAERFAGLYESLVVATRA
jgi:glycosyltransferase involved in cell wall biosynthesis